MFEFTWYSPLDGGTRMVYGDKRSIITICKELSLKYGYIINAHAYSEGREYDLEKGLDEFKKD